MRNAERGAQGGAESIREPTALERRRFIRSIIALCELSVQVSGPLSPQQELLDTYREELRELNTDVGKGKQL